MPKLEKNNYLALRAEWLYITFSNMLTTEQVNTIHRLHFAQHLVDAQDRASSPHRPSNHRPVLAHTGSHPRSAATLQQAGPLKATIAELLEHDAEANAVVIAQRLRPLGFQGGLSILKEYLRSVRVSTPAKRAYVRMEPGPGERFEIDWGHFGVLSYQGYARELYAFCLVECHSRKLYVEFTHSQSFETFVRCHIHPFHYLGGVAREL